MLDLWIHGARNLRSHGNREVRIPGNSELRIHGAWEVRGPWIGVRCIGLQKSRLS